MRSNINLHAIVASAGLFGFIAFSPETHGVVVYNDGLTPGYQTTAPAGPLASAGWQFSGHVGSFVGTPISPKHFITAKHTGAALGTFTYNAVSYTGVSIHDDPNSDLRIVRIAQTFPTWAPLYTGSSEVGKEAFLVGRGMNVGSQLNVGPNRAGWLWPAITFGHPRTWGTNVIDSIETFDPPYGQTLAFDFNPTGGPTEATLTAGDSGGGLFINDGGTWKLAGVHLSNEFVWSLTDGGTRFNASVFDGRGLYRYDNPDYTYIDPSLPNAIGGSSYSTRISARMTWINTVIPEPTTLALLPAIAVLIGRRSKRA